MPVIIGNSTDETMLFVGSLGTVTDAASFDAAVARVFGAGAVSRIRAAYPLSAYATPRQALVRLTTDALFTCQNLRVARALARSQRQPVYRYLFAHALENDPELKAQGAVHTVEHVFFFPWQGRYRPTEADRSVQRQMVGHWTHLARTGVTAGPPYAPWPAAGPRDAYLLIGPNTAAAAGAAQAKCDFWDTVPLPWPHL